jgi:hypothetical protein
MKVVLIGFTLVIVSNTLPASAAKVVTYKNCSALNLIYPGGVALPGAVNKGGTTRHAPKFSKSLYRANQKSDRDRDGIACEK